MGVDHLSGATCCRCQPRHCLRKPYGVYKGSVYGGVGVCANVYMSTHTHAHLFLEPEPKYLIVTVCEFSALGTHLDNQKAALTAVN